MVQPKHRQVPIHCCYPLEVSEYVWRWNFECFTSWHISTLDVMQEVCRKCPKNGKSEHSFSKLLISIFNVSSLHWCITWSMLCKLFRVLSYRTSIQPKACHLFNKGKLGTTTIEEGEKLLLLYLKYWCIDLWPFWVKHQWAVSDDRFNSKCSYWCFTSDKYLINNRMRT